MKQLTSLASIIILMPVFAACHVKTGLPFGPQTIGSSDVSSATAEQSQGGGIDDPTGICHQELGRDAGGKARSAHVLGADKVKGCMVQGDKVDMYLLSVPNDVEAATYSILVISHDNIINAGLYTMDGERLARNSHVGGGSSFRKNIQLRGGETYKMVIGNVYNEDRVFYTLQIKQSDIVAEN